MSLEKITKIILDFRNKRDWKQFHDPKNLAEAISIETNELLENFLWKTVEESRNLTHKESQNVKEELADIFICMIYLCKELNIDLIDEVEGKVKINKKKYPIKKAKGNKAKYTEY